MSQNILPSSPDRIIGSAELKSMVPYSNMHFWRMEKDGRFPKRIRLGANRVGWSLKEITAWIDAKKAERDTGTFGAEVMAAPSAKMLTVDDPLEEKGSDRQLAFKDKATLCRRRAGEPIRRWHPSDPDTTAIDAEV